MSGASPGSCVGIDNDGVVGKLVSQVVEDEVWQDITAMLRTRAPVLRPSYNIFGIFRDEEVWAAVFMEGLGELGSWDRRLIELFCQNASVALENHRLHHRQVALSQAFARSCSRCCTTTPTC